LKSKHEKNSGSGDTAFQCATFYVSNRLYGVDILSVREVNADMRFTSIYHAADEIKGYVNIRGQIHLVLDLSRLLGFGPAGITDKSRIVLFKPHVGESFAVLVDGVGNVVEVQGDLIEKYRRGGPENREEENAVTGEIVAGVYKLEKEILILLEPGKFLQVLAGRN